jgi:hypothetical protein
VTRFAAQLLILLALVLGLTAPAHAGPTTPAAQAPAFKVIACHGGTWDAAHIDFVKEANEWFPRTAAQNNLTYTATTDWNLLANGGVNDHQVVLFLDDAPRTAARRTGFERYVRASGGWMGFHVSAFTTDAASWPCNWRNGRATARPCRASG